MPYESIPGVRATQLDGSFATANVSNQPRILVVGPAKSGLTNELFTITQTSVAETEFGASTEVMKFMHEAVAQGANNIAVLRSGGKRGEFVLTDAAGATLTITPEYRDDDILGRYKLFIEHDGSKNRYMIFDATDEAWVFDSDEILVLDEGIVTVEDSGIELMVIGDKSLTDAGIKLDTLAPADVAAVSTLAVSIVATEGADGQTASRAERYAALEASYHVLDYKDVDMIVPTDVYIDDKNIRDDDNKVAAGTGSTDAEKYGYYWKGVPLAGSAEDALGYLWQYRHKGRVYTYMADVEDYFSGKSSEAAATLTIDTDLVLTALKAGKGGNGVTIQIVDGATAGAETATVTETDHGLAILVNVEATVSTNAQAKAAIDTALAATTLRSGILASALVSCTGGSTVSTVQGPTNLSGGLGGAILSDTDLTGDDAVAAVTTKIAAGSDAQLREVNFAHQLGSFCHVASTSWSQIVGSISFKMPPAGFSTLKIADWIGVSPAITDDGTDLYIDAPADNGTGVLGHRLISGESKTSDGYRAHMVDNGNTTDSYAYGGLILTKGASLPNGTDWPYGISDADEAVDAGGKPVDIGRYVLACYDWPILSNTFDGGTQYRGSLPSTLLGKLATMPEYEEPIGALGRINKALRPTRIHSTQLNDLSKFRLIGLRQSLLGVIGFTSVKTLAHPDSDYTRVSTIRSVNRMLSGCRTVANAYLGKPFSAQSLASLQAALDGFTLEEQARGTHQGAKTRIEYTREDRIMGRLSIKLRMIPPFSIEFIDVEISLAADESEL